MVFDRYFLGPCSCSIPLFLCIVISLQSIALILTSWRSDFGSIPWNAHAWTQADTDRQAKRGNARIVFGAYVGDVSTIMLGIHEDGFVDAMLTPVLGEKVIKIGRCGIEFPFAPAVHVAMHEGTKQTLEAAYYLLNNGANVNEYQIPSYFAHEMPSKQSKLTGNGLGFPPAILLNLGLGMKPENSHAALLQRLFLSLPKSFNFTKINQWRKVTANPPLLQIPLLKNFFDGMFVLHSVMNVSLKEVDCYGVSALHVAAWMGHVDAVNYLLYSGATRFAVDIYGRTPLHYAALRGFDAVIKSLLSNNGDSEQVLDQADKDDDKKTSSSEWANPNLPASTIKQQKKSYLSMKDKNGHSALELALAVPTLHRAVSILRQQYNALRLVPTEKMSRHAIQRSSPFVNREWDIAVGRHKQSCEILDNNWEQLMHCHDIPGTWRGGWFWPELCMPDPAKSDSCSRRQLWLQDSLMDSVGSLRPFDLNAPQDIDFLVDSEHNVNDNEMSMFYKQYYLTQRPVNIDGLFDRSPIWAEWRKHDFLNKFGHLRVAESIFSQIDRNATEILTIREWVQRHMLDVSRDMSRSGVSCVEDHCALDLHHNKQLFSAVTIDQEANTMLTDSITIPSSLRVCSDSLPVVDHSLFESARECLHVKSQLAQPTPAAFTMETDAEAEIRSLDEILRNSDDIVANKLVFMSPEEFEVVVSSDLQNKESELSLHNLDLEELEMGIDSSSTNNENKVAQNFPLVDDSLSLAELWMEAEREHLDKKRQETFMNTEFMKLVLSSVGSGEALHQHNASWSLLLTGVVQWFLIPPDSGRPIVQELLHDWETMSELLTAKDTTMQESVVQVHGKRLRSFKRNKTTEFFDLLAPRYWQHSAMVATFIQQGQLFRVTQYPGDTVVIPHNWYHATLALVDSISVTREFCTLVNTNHRMQPLGPVIYGGKDDNRGLGQPNALTSFRPGKNERKRKGLSRPDNGIPVIEGMQFKT